MNISRRRFLAGSAAFAVFPSHQTPAQEIHEPPERLAFWHKKDVFNPKLKLGSLVRAVDDNGQLDIMFYDGYENGKPKFSGSQDLAINVFINMQFYHLGQNDNDKLALLAARRFDVLQKQKSITKAVSHLLWRSRADAARAVLSGQIAKVEVDRLCHDPKWLNKELTKLLVQGPGILEKFAKKPDEEILPPYDPRYNAYEQGLITRAINTGQPLVPVVEYYLKNYEQIRRDNPWPPKLAQPDEPIVPTIKMNRASAEPQKASLQACIPA